MVHAEFRWNAMIWVIIDELAYDDSDDDGDTLLMWPSGWAGAHAPSEGYPSSPDNTLHNAPPVVCYDAMYNTPEYRGPLFLCNSSTQSTGQASTVCWDAMDDSPDVIIRLTFSDDDSDDDVRPLTTGMQMVCWDAMDDTPDVVMRLTFSDDNSDDDVRAFDHTHAGGPSR